MLSISYRFNSKICAFPSRRLYNGELASDASVAAIRLSDLDNVDEDEDFDEAVVFVDSECTPAPLRHTHSVSLNTAAGQAMYERAGEEGSFGAESKSNENEADICARNQCRPQRGGECAQRDFLLTGAKYVHSLLKLGVLPSNITVIAPYNAQVTLLSSILQPLGVEVGSIDGEQGRENEVVIISLVRSNMKVRCDRMSAVFSADMPVSIGSTKSGSWPSSVVSTCEAPCSAPPLTIERTLTRGLEL